MSYHQKPNQQGDNDERWFTLKGLMNVEIRIRKDNKGEKKERPPYNFRQNGSMHNLSPEIRVISLSVSQLKMDPPSLSQTSITTCKALVNYMIHSYCVAADLRRSCGNETASAAMESSRQGSLNSSIDSRFIIESAFPTHLITIVTGIVTVALKKANMDYLSDPKLGCGFICWSGWHSCYMLCRADSSGAAGLVVVDVRCKSNSWDFLDEKKGGGDHKSRYKSCRLVITEYLVNISKRSAFWNLNEDILKINDSDNQYIVSIKEDTAYLSLAATRYRGKAIANSHPPTYDPKPKVVADDDASSKEKEIDKLMDLISMSFKNIYKPTNNNLRTSLNTNNLNVDNTLRSSRGTGYARQTGHYDNQREVKVAGVRKNVGTQKPKRARDLAYHKEKMLLCKQEEAGIQLSAEHVDWRDDINDEPEDQELEAHYMFMAKIQEVTPDAVDNSGPIFDAEPLQKVHNSDDGYNVFANERHHPKQHESINDTYLMEQGVTPRQGENARRNENGYHHNIMVSTIEKSK
ncbi:hypothetical protein Tco_0452669 [Tanacetum coccineum]